MVDDPCCCGILVFCLLGFLRNFDPGREEGIVGLQWFEI